MAFARRDFSGSAAATTLASGITSSATSLVLASSTGWPTGANGKFLVAIGRASATEEKLWVQSRSGTTLTLASSGDRGAEGTTAQAHSAGDTVEHVAGSTDADEANNLVSQILGTLTTKGDMPIASGASALGRLAAGANNRVLVADNAQTLGAKYAQVDENMLASSVAGNALTGGNGTALNVGVDNTTIEVNTDALRIKDAAITGAKLAAAVVDNSSIEIASSQLRVKASGVTNAMLAGGIATSKLTLANWTAFTPAWVSSVGTPVVNNGTITGAYFLFGKIMFMRIQLVFGTTTDPGGAAGIWSFGVGGGQTSVNAKQTLSAICIGPGSARYAATALIPESSSSVQRVAVNDGGQGVGITSPFTWASTHQLAITGSFEVA